MMRETIILFTLLLATPMALAQEEDPTVNDSDFNTTAPPDDQAYLDEAEAEANGEPTLSDSDFDTSLPEDDQSYLDEAASEAGAGDGAGAGSADTPFLGPLGLVAALAVVALVARRDA